MWETVPDQEPGYGQIGDKTFPEGKKQKTKLLRFIDSNIPIDFRTAPVLPFIKKLKTHLFKEHYS